MKSLSFGELHALCVYLQSWVGAQLQDVLQTESEVGLGFYHERTVHWLWIDLHSQRPLLVPLSKPPARKKTTKPVTLFLKAHAIGKRLVSIHVDPTLGRIVSLRLMASAEHPELDVTIEIRLFPHGQNLLVNTAGKSVSWNKVKDLPPAVPQATEGENQRTVEEIRADWLGGRKASSPATGAAEVGQVEREFRRLVDKKRRALERMREDLSEKERNVWSEIGEWIKAHWTLDVPPEWSGYIHPNQSIAENLEICFQKSKDSQRKQEGTRDRIALLESEVAELESLGPDGWYRRQTKGPSSPRANPMAAAGAKGRKLDLAPDLTAYIGKSAADNLALLRKAQAWDFWLHLRDYPGSHAIIRRTRAREVTESEFARVANWVIEQSLGRKAQEMKGETFDVLIAECRFVRPIKGDRLGRVNYTNDRVIPVRFV